MIGGNTRDISWDLTSSGFTLDGVLIKDGRIPGGHLAVQVLWRLG